MEHDVDSFIQSLGKKPKFKVSVKEAHCQCTSPICKHEPGKCINHEAFLTLKNPSTDVSLRICNHCAKHYKGTIFCGYLHVKSAKD